MYYHDNLTSTVDYVTVVPQCDMKSIHVLETIILNSRFCVCGAGFWR